MPALLEEALLPGVAEDPMLPDPEWGELPVSREVLPLGELGLSIVREEPVLPAPEDMPLPGDEPPPALWLWTNAGTAKAEILTARNACHSLLFFIRLCPFLICLENEALMLNNIDGISLYQSELCCSSIFTAEHEYAFPMPSLLKS